MIQYEIKQQNLILYQKMSLHRIKLTGIQPNSQLFSHQQSVNQYLQSKHKKKRSVYNKPESRQYTRLKTDQKEPMSILKQQHYTPFINLVQSTNSISKLGKVKFKNMVNLQNNKTKRNSKHTISAINLIKNVEQSKVKGSSTIRRKHSTTNFDLKLKQKIEDFRIVSSCLEEYIREQRRSSNEVNLLEVFKIISAFNRSQIAPVSRPLQKLITEIIQSIQGSIPEPKMKSILKKSISFKSPKKNDDQDEEIKITVKKGQNSKQFMLKKGQHPGQVNKLQENLGRLKYESNRLKFFLDQISARQPQSPYQKDEENQQIERNKLDQLNELREIVKYQERMIKQLEDGSQEGTFRSDSLN